MKKSYYEILGVKDDATLSQIKERYQKLREKYDPKKNPERKETKKWRDIKEAYKVLSNKESRQQYDETRVVEETTLVVPEENKKVEPQQEVEVKAYFLPRLLAYVIDIFLVTMVASLVFSLFPSSENVVELNEQLTELQKKYINQEVTNEEYIAQSFDLSYDLAYQNVIYVIIDVALIVGYFVIFQYKRGGRTIGKQLMKIKIVSNDSNKSLTMNQYLYRALILQAVALNIISVVGVLLIPKGVYGSFSFSLQFLQIIINITTIIMVLYRKDGRGLHDIIAGTKVVVDGSKEKVLCEN